MYKNALAYYIQRWRCSCKFKSRRIGPCQGISFAWNNLVDLVIEKLFKFNMISKIFFSAVAKFLPIRPHCWLETIFSVTGYS
jgi:hypothetical protein